MEEGNLDNLDTNLALNDKELRQETTIDDNEYMITTQHICNARVIR